MSNPHNVQQQYNIITTVINDALSLVYVISEGQSRDGVRNSGQFSVPGYFVIFPAHVAVKIRDCSCKIGTDGQFFLNYYIIKKHNFNKIFLYFFLFTS